MLVFLPYSKKMCYNIFKDRLYAFFGKIFSVSIKTRILI